MVREERPGPAPGGQGGDGPRPVRGTFVWFRLVLAFIAAYACIHVQCHSSTHESHPTDCIRRINTQIIQADDETVPEPIFPPTHQFATDNVSSFSSEHVQVRPAASASDLVMQITGIDLQHPRADQEKLRSARQMMGGLIKTIREHFLYVHACIYVCVFIHPFRSETCHSTRPIHQ